MLRILILKDVPQRSTPLLHYGFPGIIDLSVRRSQLKSPMFLSESPSTGIKLFSQILIEEVQSVVLEKN